MIELLFALLCAARADGLGTYLTNRAGVKALNEKDNFRAYQTFTRGLIDDPMSLTLQLNLATTFERNEEWDKAVDVYRGVLEVIGPDHPQRFEVLFNLGVALAHAKKIPLALDAYQAALEIKPDSVEVKTNIELLLSGGGGDGEGDSQSDKSSEDGKDEKEKDKRDNNQKREDSLKQKDKDKEQDGKEKKPKPFQSKELSQEDVKRILDELKNQEQSIRAEEYEKSPKDGARNGKDW